MCDASYKATLRRLSKLTLMLLAFHPLSIVRFQATVCWYRLLSDCQHATINAIVLRLL